MSRPVRIALIASLVLVFLVLSGLLARWLQVENVERDAVLGLLRSQARGDAPAMLATLRGCDAPCRKAVAADASALRGPGDVKILAYASGTSYSLAGASGRTRVAWKLPGRLPVVQCVTVRRGGNALSGISISLLSIGTPIAGTADCS